MSRFFNNKRLTDVQTDDQRLDASVGPFRLDALKDLVPFEKIFIKIFSCHVLQKFQ